MSVPSSASSRLLDRRGAHPSTRPGRRLRAGQLTVLGLAVLGLVLSACSSHKSYSTTKKNGKTVTNVTLAIATYSGNYGPYLTALDKGFYEKNGLHVKLIEANGATSIPGLISGSLTFAAAAASAPPAILKGYKVKVVSVNVDSPPYLILAQKSVPSLAALKGKSLGVQSKGDSTDIVAKAYLKKNGIDPTTVTNIAIGGNSARLAALTSGSIPAVVTNPQDLQELQEKGDAGKYRVLGTIQGAVKFPIAGTVVSTKLLTGNSDLVKKFLTATAQGENYFLNNETYSIGLLSREAKESKTAAKADFDDSGTWTNCACLDGPTQTQVIADYAASSKVKVVPNSTVYDFSLVNALYPSIIKGAAADGTIVKNKLPQTDALVAS
jgi:ABC-type nitrate/sulfonate/bicarbonate transport system substrate-binding protein